MFAMLGVLLTLLLLILFMKIQVAI